MNEQEFHIINAHGLQTPRLNGEILMEHFGQNPQPLNINALTSNVVNSNASSPNNGNTMMLIDQEFSLGSGMKPKGYEF